MLNFTASTNITLENGTLNGSIPAGVVLAIFLPDPVNVTFDAVAGGGGVVVAGFGYVPSGGSISLIPGVNYTASAAPGSDLGFVLWSTPDTNKIVWNRAPGTWTELQVVNQTATVLVTYASGAMKTLTFQVSPVGAGQINFNGNNSYINGDTNTTVIAGETYLDSAVAYHGFTFQAWSASGSLTVTHPSSSNSTVKVSGTGTLIATFVATTFPVTVLASPPQPATLEVDGAPVSEGSTLMLAPGAHSISASGAGEVFESWTSTPGTTVVDAALNSTTFTVSGSGAMTAIFTPFGVSTPVLAPAPVDVGFPVDFQSYLPYAGNFSIAWSGLPPGCPVDTSLTFDCTPTVAGSYEVSVTFTDAWGAAAASYTVPLLVNPSPTLSSVNLSWNALDVGALTTISATEIGGTGPFEWTYGGLPTGCTSENQTSLGCDPSVTGEFNLTVNVTDKFGEVARGAVELVVNPLPTIHVSVTPTSVMAGTPVAFVATLAGGTGPFSLQYQNLPPGCVSSSAASLTCTPTTAGTYVVNVSSHDAFWNWANQSVTLTVTGQVSPIISPSSFELALGLIVLVVIATAVFVTLRSIARRSRRSSLRRRPPRPPPRPRLPRRPRLPSGRRTCRPLRNGTRGADTQASDNARPLAVAQPLP